MSRVVELQGHTARVLQVDSSICQISLGPYVYMFYALKVTYHLTNWQGGG
jgi:hypothetical protein